MQNISDNNNVGGILLNDGNDNLRTSKKRHSTVSFAQPQSSSVEQVLERIQEHVVLQELDTPPTLVAPNMERLLQGLSTGSTNDFNRGNLRSKTMFAIGHNETSNMVSKLLSQVADVAFGENYQDEYSANQILKILLQSDDTCIFMTRHNDDGLSCKNNDLRVYFTNGYGPVVHVLTLKKENSKLQQRVSFVVMESSLACKRIVSVPANLHIIGEVLVEVAAFRKELLSSSSSYQYFTNKCGMQTTPPVVNNGNCLTSSQNPNHFSQQLEPTYSGYLQTLQRSNRACTIAPSKEMDGALAAFHAVDTNQYIPPMQQQPSDYFYRQEAPGFSSRDRLRMLTMPTLYEQELGVESSFFPQGGLNTNHISPLSENSNAMQSNTTSETPKQQDEPRMNLVESLDLKTEEDDKRVVTVRKVHKLGYNSIFYLKEFFAKFGKVVDVVLLPMRATVNNDSHIKRRYNRPSSMGFVVMENEEQIAKILANSVYEINGYAIEVRNFVRPADK